MSVIDKIEARIKQKESCRLIAYYDTSDPPVLTVGWGHACKASDGLRENDTISQAHADDLLRHDLAWTMTDVMQIIHNFPLRPEPVQIAMAEMCYNNGTPRFKKFTDTIAAVNASDYKTAADEIVDSVNYRRKDLHSRYEEIQLMVRGAA